jgi:D-arabinose 1-dehydrogenase-like Zn-dependent alcohol dehydrogenase
VVRSPGRAETALRLETLPDPSPGPGQVVVQVEACGVCFHDVVTRNGTLKAGIAPPFIPGHEICGRIVAIGSDVRGVSVGQRVATTQRGHVCGVCRHCTGGREPLCAEAACLGDPGKSRRILSPNGRLGDLLHTALRRADPEAAAIAARLKKLKIPIER